MIFLQSLVILARSPTWLGFGFATWFPFNLRGRLVWLCSRLFALFAAFADSPPGAAGHEQGRGRLSAWKKAQSQQAGG